MKRDVLIGPCLFVLLWFVVGKLSLIDTFFFPDSFSVFRELFREIFDGLILHDLFSTFVRVGMAFFIALCVGLPIGLFLGRSEHLYRRVEFLIDFFRSTPATAIFPLFLLVFGITDVSKIAVAAFASSLVIIFNTAHGVMHAKKSRLLAAQIMGATPWQIFRWILFWESLPQTFVGVRSAVSLSLVIIIVTEMFVGTSSGLGRRIIDAQITYEIEAMYAAILLAGLLGYAFNLGFLLMEKKVLHWSGK